MNLEEVFLLHASRRVAMLLMLKACLEYSISSPLLEDALTAMLASTHHVYLASRIAYAPKANRLSTLQLLNLVCENDVHTAVTGAMEFELWDSLQQTSSAARQLFCRYALRWFIQAPSFMQFVGQVCV